MKSWLKIGGPALALCFSLAAGAQKPAPPAPTKLTPEQTQFFESKIRPLLTGKCAPCHVDGVSRGGLSLDFRESWQKGGGSGPAVVPGSPEKSVLIQRVKSAGAPMPPGGKLSESEIAALETWVKMGAPDPRSAREVKTTSKLTGLTDKAKQHWAFQPVEKPAIPKVKNASWVKNPIDSFVLAKLEASGMAPNPLANRATLIRRAYYDLIGMPPTVEEVREFLADKSPNAWEKVVDRLLASPRYGERMARFWMDVARYADTKGYVFTDDRNYYHAYTYRDWLIQSFNDDMPYDRFLMYQLAADRMQEGDDRKHLAALGYLTLGRRFINNLHDIIDDRIDVTMRGMQGLTVACARCHDHKFDPISAKDYYGLYAIFASSDEYEPAVSPKTVREPYEHHDGQFLGAKNEREETIRSEVRRLRETVKAGTATPELQKTLQGFRENELPNDAQRTALLPSFDPAKRERLAVLERTMEELKKTYPPKPEFAHAMREGKPRPGVVFKRGNPGSPGEPAPRHFLTCIAGEQPEFPTGGRLELAQAIADKKNPLTARVIANRIWLQHFGTGLVRTPSDFGQKGERPTHPELLDWLAAGLMDDGWSLKKLHRKILLSATWMQSSAVSETSFVKDPENRLYGRQNRKRLELEQLRDSLLLASGALDLSKLGGKSEELWQGNYTKRRAVYGFIERQNLPGIFKTLDFATPDVSSPQRFKTIVPQQALFLMNAPLVADQARTLAKEIQGKDDAEKVVVLYGRLLARRPEKDELNLALNYLSAPDRSALKPESQLGPWRYGWGSVDETTGRTQVFNAFSVFADGQWQAGAKVPDPAHGWVLLRRDGGHPGGDAQHMVIRRWISPVEGTVSVAGTLNHPGTVGDGVRARVVHVRQGVVGEWTAQNSKAETRVETIAVKRGDTLDFVVDCRTNENTDSFNWAPSVTLTGAKRLAWRSERDFGGPPPAPPVPLSKWERYAQALLMTNEFLYVD